jgi:hypothetical protein
MHKRKNNMRAVEYTDDKGRIKKVLVKDDDDDSMAEFGVLYGPPDLDALDWEQIKTEMNNYLATAGLYTWDDVQRLQNQQSIIGAVNIFRRHLIALYKTGI